MPGEGGEGGGRESHLKIVMMTISGAKLLAQKSSRMRDSQEETYVTRTQCVLEINFARRRDTGKLCVVLSCFSIPTATSSLTAA